VRVRENIDDWRIEHILITLQQHPDMDVMQLTELVLRELEHAYARLKKHDRRWRARWQDIQVLVNPNGPLINGGSDGDNGQTGRKLVMDYYGPRVPIGGGAISGKDLSHIDRAAAYAAREAALSAVVTGATSCKVVLSYAPNLNEPLDVIYDMEAVGRRLPVQWFTHRSIVVRYRKALKLDMVLPHELPSELPPPSLMPQKERGVIKLRGHFLEHGLDTLERGL